MLLKCGRLVKGVAFAEHRDAGKPATTARAYNAQKADEVLLIDIAGSDSPGGPDLDTLTAVASECQIPVTFGGGIASLATARECLRRGADKIYVNRHALRCPSLIGELARGLGSQAVVLGLDLVATTDGDWRLREVGLARDRSWREWLAEGVGRGAGEIRLMSVSREGTRSGLDVALYKAAIGLVDVPVVLEGGAGTLADVERAMREGVDAVALGTMLVFSDNNIVQVKRHLKNAGFPIRL